MKTIRIGNLGAGVQSTTCFLLEREGKIAPTEAWIFADTGEEPQAVYDHLAWLESLGSPRIIRAGLPVRLGDQLSKGMNSTGQRFVSVPAYTAELDDVQREGRAATGCNYGQMQRQCTKEYKIDVIEQAIRKQIIGLKPRQRFPKDVHVVQLFGLSDDEPRRIRRIKENYERHPWASPGFPLVDLGWTRADCVEWLRSCVPHETPRSACVFCPYRSAIEWERLKKDDPKGWGRAVAIDRALRVDGNVVNRGFDQKLYLHRSCLPLDVIDIEAEAARERARPKQPDLFKWSCMDGMCGV